MSDPQVRLFDRCTPLVPAGGAVTIGVTQTLSDGGPQLLDWQGPAAVKFVVEGPRLRLSPDDIAGVYPTPGSEESPDEFLPHVALKRRTLPWERAGPTAAASPWVALLVLKESELAFTSTQAGTPGAVVHASTLNAVKAIDPAAHTSLTGATPPFPAAAPTDWVYLTNAQAARLLPSVADTGYLCHVKRVTTDEAKSIFVDHAVVVANRLPDAGPPEADEPAERHVALLVSLERRADLWTIGRATKPNDYAALLVLHHWTFTPSRGGDFEQVMQAIRYRPNGGVLRFGSLPAAMPSPQAPMLSGGFPALVTPNGAFHDPLQHEQRNEQNQDVVYRGPLRPFEAAARTDAFAVQAAPDEYEGDELPAGTPDFTYATAFELGRLLALGDAGILDDLRDIHLEFPLIEPPIAKNDLPPVLQRPDWVSNPAWVEQPWEMSQGPLLEDGGVILKYGEIDLGGIAGQVGQWGGVLKGTLEPLATPAMPPVVTVDIGAVTVGSLGIQFAAVQAAAQS